MLQVETAGNLGVQWAWIAPALSASAFFLIIVLGRFLRWQGAFLSILAIMGGFGVFCYVLREFLSSGGGIFSVDWFSVGESTFTWGIMVDELSVVMLGLVPFVALMGFASALTANSMLGLTVAQGYWFVIWGIGSLGGLVNPSVKAVRYLFPTAFKYDYLFMTDSHLWLGMLHQLGFAAVFFVFGLMYFRWRDV